MSRQYIDVNIPKRYEPYFDELLRDKNIKTQLEDGYTLTHSGLGKWIIMQYLSENTSYRFKYVNTRDNHIIIQDKIKGTRDIYIHENNELWCEQDNSTNCEHVNFAYQIPEVRVILAEKGWDLPEEREGGMG